MQCSHLHARQIEEKPVFVQANSKVTFYSILQAFELSIACQYFISDWNQTSRQPDVKMRWRRSQLKRPWIRARGFYIYRSFSACSRVLQAHFCSFAVLLLSSVPNKTALLRRLAIENSAPSALSSGTCLYRPYTGVCWAPGVLFYKSKEKNHMQS